jgi:hypothetical protein
MEINVTIILKVLLIFSSNFLVLFYLYRYVFYPKLRWQQKDNICHDDRLERCFALSILFSVIEMCIYSKLIIFTF